MRRYVDSKAPTLESGDTVRVSAREAANQLAR
jgi:hypothetical protein